MALFGFETHVLLAGAGRITARCDAAIPLESLSESLFVQVCDRLNQIVVLG